MTMRLLVLTPALLAATACGAIVEPVTCTLDRASLVSYDAQGRVQSYVCP